MALGSGKSCLQNLGGPGKKGRLLFIAVGGVTVLAGLVVLITWLATKPEKPKYFLEYGSVSRFEITEEGLVNSKFNFNITTRNSNKKVAIYYDEIDAFLSYDDEEIAWDSIPPFFQPHKNTTALQIPISGFLTSLPPDTSRDLKLEQNSGKVDLVFRLNAKIRFKKNNWKSGHYKLRVKCRHVVLDVANKADTGSFQRKKCHVRL